jgi:hypothetical protein
VPVHRDPGSLCFALLSAVSPFSHHAPKCVPHALTRGQPYVVRAALHNLPLLLPVSRGGPYPSDIHCRHVVFTRWRVDLFCWHTLPSSALPVANYLLRVFAFLFLGFGLCGKPFFYSFCYDFSSTHPCKGLLFPLPNQCTPLNPRKRVVVLNMVECSFKSHAPALHCFGALFALCGLIIGFVQGKKDRILFD